MKAALALQLGVHAADPVEGQGQSAHLSVGDENHSRGMRGALASQICRNSLILNYVWQWIQSPLNRK